MPRAAVWLVLLCCAGARATLAAPACPAEGPALQVLGSGDSSLTARRAGSGVLIWMDGKARVLINAGTGVALRFQESGAQWNDLDAIVFTRMDVAHSADLPALLQAAHASGRNRALPVYGPPGNKLAPSTVTFVRDLFDPVRGAYRHLGNLLASLDRTGYKLEPHDVREPPAKLATPRRAGPALLPVFSNASVQIQAVLHTGAPVPVLSWRVDTGATGFVILDGAQGSPETLATLAEGAALLVLPNLPEEAAGRAGPAPQQTLRARQTVLIGRGARGAGREDEVLAAVRKSAAGAVVWADDLTCYRP